MKTFVTIAIGSAIVSVIAACAAPYPPTGQSEFSGAISEESAARDTEPAHPAISPLESVTDLLDRPLPPPRMQGIPVTGLTFPNAGGTSASNAFTETSELVLLPTITPATILPDTSPPDEGITAVVDASLANIRGGPGTNYQVVGQVQTDADLVIVGRDEVGDWLRICCPIENTVESWISAALVRISGPYAEALYTIPVAAIPPTPEPPPVAPSAGQSTRLLAAAPAPGLPGSGSFGISGDANPLTGLSLAANRTGMRPVIVCINNDYAARPQFGTSQADVAYEYVMEGYGITRFSALFYGTPSVQIGPVRSARLINYYMGALYDAGLACSGASDQVRYLLKHQAPFPYLDIDLDDPSNSRYSVSIGSDYRTRLRTSDDKLHHWLSDWGVEQPASLRGFTFGEAPNGGVRATSIQIPYPRATGSQVDYQFDPGSGRYLRSLGGGPHVDGNTGAQLAVENVIVQFIPHENTDIVEDSLGSTSIRLNLFGSGKAIVFRDGLAFEGFWRSDSRGDTPHFTDQSGAEIPLKPGRTWISVVPHTYTIAY